MSRSLSAEELRALQLSELDILRDFRAICEKYHLRYYLQAGTLLGAVRHKGFIPWDDDVDVLMFREDIDKLPEIFAKENDPRYFLQNNDTDTNFPYYFTKVRKNNTEVYEDHLREISMHKGQYIDVIPLDVCPKNPRLARIYFKAIELLTCVYVSKVDASFVCQYKKWYMKALFRFYSFFSLDRIRRIRRRMASLPAGIGRSPILCSVGGVHGYPAETYHRDWFSSSVELSFEGETFSAPCGWHELLSNMYGDYMTPPPDKSGHFLVLENDGE